MAKNLCLFLLLVLLSSCSPIEETKIPEITENDPVQSGFIQLTEAVVVTVPQPTLDPAVLPVNCLDEAAAADVVERWLSRNGFNTLNDAWDVFLEDYGENNLISSTTDYNNDFAHAVTWEKMLFVGEFPFQVNLDGKVGVGYCAVLVYTGGVGPEIGLGITDVEWNGTWSGYASGLVENSEATRTYLAEQVGKAVTVRYMVSRNPQDEGFERAGFFSPLMRRLWEPSYYTLIPTDLNFLFERVGQPRGPSIRELMGLASELQGYGVFLEYIVNTIL